MIDKLDLTGLAPREQVVAVVQATRISESEDDPARRVAAGCLLLDSTVPDWAQRIDLAKFDLVDGDGCVLGYVFGGYSQGLKHYDLLSDERPIADEAFGFCAWERDVAWDGEWDELDREWRREIAARQAAVPA